MGVSTNIGQHFAETLQFEDLAVKSVFLFYYVNIFLKKIFNWYQMHFSWMLKKGDFDNVRIGADFFYGIASLM